VRFLLPSASVPTFVNWKARCAGLRQRPVYWPAITISYVKEVLYDLLTLQEKLVTIENIQKTVADYYKIPVDELLSNSGYAPCPPPANRDGVG